MDSSGRRFGWVLGIVACAALVAVPLRAGAPEESDAKAQGQQAGKESELVKAANAAKKKAEAKTYTNDDLEEGESPKLTYTNEDLARMFGPSRDESTEASPGSSGSAAASGSDDSNYDPLAAMEKEKQENADREKRITEAESTLAAAQAKLKNLEVELLATRNPFSARPQLSEEEKEHRATAGESAAERNARVQKAVEKARAEVAEAEAALAQARAQ